MITGFGLGCKPAGKLAGLSVLAVLAVLRMRAHVPITAAVTAPTRTVTPEERHIVPGGHFA